MKTAPFHGHAHSHSGRPPPLPPLPPLPPRVMSSCSGSCLVRIQEVEFALASIYNGFKARARKRAEIER